MKYKGKCRDCSYGGCAAGGAQHTYVFLDDSGIIWNQGPHCQTAADRQAPAVQDAVNGISSEGNKTMKISVQE